jgi:hypothetical protein
MTRVTYRTVEEMVRRDASFAPTFEIEPFLKQDHRGWKSSQWTGDTLSLFSNLLLVNEFELVGEPVEEC